MNIVGTMENQDVIDLLASYAACVMNATKHANFGRGGKEPMRRERAAARRLLTKLFGRRATEEEIDAITPG